MCQTPKSPSAPTSTYTGNEQTNEKKTLLPQTGVSPSLWGKRNKQETKHNKNSPSSQISNRRLFFLSDCLKRQVFSLGHSISQPLKTQPHRGCATKAPSQRLWKRTRPFFPTEGRPPHLCTTTAGTVYTERQLRGAALCRLFTVRIRDFSILPENTPTAAVQVR